MGGGATGVASSGWSDGIPLERKTKAKYKRKHGSIPCHLITIYGRLVWPPPIFSYQGLLNNPGGIMESVTIEIRSAEGGDDSKLLIRDMAGIYAKACKRRGL